ncbi:sigma-70 family RNA polymerase sigma factor [Candidatus Poribacteria bacterium]|nr:sigma-70 family RNA polymerase sigma factor [Candidatus Poribacteria bacterium]
MATTFDTGLVWEETRRGLLAFVQRRVATPQDAEDLVQDVLIRMHANLSRLRDTDRVMAWAYGIARNAITDYYRSRANASGAMAQLEDENSGRVSGPTAVEDDQEGELAACMRPYVSRLPDPYHEALRLVELEGMTQVDAARRVGISGSGMKSRVQRGRGMVRAMLSECCDVELAPAGGIAGYEARDPRESCDC